MTVCCCCPWIIGFPLTKSLRIVISTIFAPRACRRIASVALRHANFGILCGQTKFGRVSQTTCHMSDDHSYILVYFARPETDFYMWMNRTSCLVRTVRCFPADTSFVSYSYHCIVNLLTYLTLLFQNSHKLENCSRLRIEVEPTALILNLTLDLDVWPRTSVSGVELWSWPIHIYKVKIEGHSVQVETNGRTDRQRRLHYDPC